MYSRSFIFLLLFTISPLKADDNLLRIDSGEAEYDGQNITLTGNVQVEHAIGKISGHEMKATSSEGGKQFSKLFIQKDVKIELSGGGSLSCQNAEVDYANLSGCFYGTSENPQVIYDNQEASSHLVINGTKLLVDFARNQTLKNQVELAKIQLQDGVKAIYAQKYELSGEKAIYQRNTTSENTWQGNLTITDSKSGFCSVKTVAGDDLQAKQIDLDTKTKQIVFEQVHGIIQSKDKIAFQAKTMIWEDNEDALTLNQQVEIKNAFLQVKTPHELKIVRYLNNGKNEIKSIQTSLSTELIYYDEKKISHRLNAPGGIFIDHQNLQGKMQGLKDGSESSQVYFEDLLGEMNADEIDISYIDQQGKLTPSKVILSGNVKLCNCYNDHSKESDSVLQYALADCVEYDPLTQNMLLIGQNGKRVLFFDKINSVQMSAPQLKVHYDKQSGKEKVQGLGDVRFTFIEKEFEEFKKRFKFNDKSKIRLKNE